MSYLQNFDAGQSDMTHVGVNTVITYDRADVITLTGVLLEALCGPPVSIGPKFEINGPLLNADAAL
jgi:hypothetical protein